MKIIDVKELELVGEGGYKVVYNHPHAENRVIKLMRPERIGPDGGFKKHSRFKRNSMQGAYRQFRREIIQYLQLCKSNFSALDYKFPIETPVELVKTNIGLGLVAEKIVAPSGKVESLAYLVENKKFEQRHRVALDEFFENCKKLHVVYGEVNANGIMYTESRNKKPEFVLVDGIGEKLAIPLRSWIKWNNDRYIEKVRKKIYSELKL